MASINLPVYGIVIEVNLEGGSIVSTLKEPCTHCGESNCNYDCDGSKGADEEHERDEMRALYNAAIDGLESFILSLACVGIDINEPKFLEAIETTVTAIANNY